MGTKWALLCLCLVIGQEVSGFSFPNDWYKIRQMMEERRRKEQELDSGPSLMVRGGFGGEPEPVHFEDEYEDLNAYRERDWSTTTQAPTSPPPPIVLDPIMEEMMKMVNWTELEARFGGGEPQGLSVRNAFGSSFEEPEPTPAPYRASDSVWKFTLAMVKAGLKDSATGNSLFSPISILTTINMLMLGTRGTTKSEVLQALGYPRYTSQVHTQFRHIINSMNRDIGVTVETSNALFTQTGFPIQQAFIDDLRRHYGNEIDLVPVNFARSRTALGLINRFVSRKTKGLIPRMLERPVAPTSKAVVSNCLYFNGTWEYEFIYEPDENGINLGSRNDTFHSFNNPQEMTYMSVKLDFPYYKDDTLEIFSLPYEHDQLNEEISEAHMFLMRPSQEGEAAFEELERTFASLDFEEIFQKMEITNAGLELPKMKLDFSANLKPALQDIGIHKLFSGETSKDFSPLTSQWEDFVLDTLQHKAVLKITERGTEAAAATTGVQWLMAPFLNITFDRPFFLFIYDALNKVVIFWGRVVEPERLFN